MSAGVAPVVRHGRVVEFDEAVGLGVVESDVDSGVFGVQSGEESGEESGVERYPFHCTQIRGGSRTIDVGTEVSFTVLAGRLGRWEAAGVGPA